MNTDPNDTALLPREQLIELLCTADGKGQWAKMFELTKMFAAIDRLGDSIIDLQTLSQEVKVTQMEMRMLCDKVIQERDALLADRDSLIRDRNEWKKLAEVLGVHP